MKKYTLALLAAIITPAVAGAADNSQPGIEKHNAPSLPGEKNERAYDVNFNGGDVKFVEQGRADNAAAAGTPPKDENNQKLKERTKQFPPYNS